MMWLFEKTRRGILPGGWFRVTRVVCCVILFTVFLFPAAAEPYIESEPDNKKHPLVAGSETILSNVVLLGFTAYVFNFAWARPTAAVIRGNLTNAWQWEETDGFKVNQIGHPYNGSIYFNAGRANGFTFYESVAFSTLGSFTWEAFFEHQSAAMNDLVTTSTAGAPIGEMLHRLYLEAHAAGAPAPVSMAISPADGLTRLVTRRKPEQNGGNFYEFTVSSGGGYADMYFIEDTNNKKEYSFRGGLASFGLNIIYGDPFDQQSTIPYEHFELSITLGADLGKYFDGRLISDGYLFSFSPVWTERNALTTGLSLHYDFVSIGKFDISDSNIDHSSSALDWTLKYQHHFNNDWAFQTKLHAGWTLLGTSEIYSIEKGWHYKNYGTGTNVKLSLAFEQENKRKLSVDVCHYFMTTWPTTTELDYGNVYWVYADITYCRQLTDRLSLGIKDSFVFERAYFSGEFPNTRKRTNAVTFFVKWSILSDKYQSKYR